MCAVAYCAQSVPQSLLPPTTRMKIFPQSCVLLLSSFFIMFNSPAQTIDNNAVINRDLLPVPSFSLDFAADALKKAGARYPDGQGFSFIQGRNGRPAVQFYGIDQPSVIQIPNTPSLQFSVAATVDMWVKITANYGMNGEGNKVQRSGWLMSLLAKSHDRNGFVLLVMRQDPDESANKQANFVSYDQTWNGIACEELERVPSIPVGEWYRVTAVASSKTGTHIYINKKLAVNCLNARPNFKTGNSQDLYIGRFKDSWYPVHGAIQDLRIYQSALSEQQILALP